MVLVFEDLHWADDGAAGLRRPAPRACRRRAAARPRPAPVRSCSSAGRAGAEASSTRLTHLARPPHRRRHGAARPIAARAPAARRRRTLARSSPGPAATRCTPSSTRGCCSSEGGELDRPLPETVQGIIAARLDAPAASRRSSCSRTPPCIGKVFWLGAVEHGGRGRARSRRRSCSHALERKEFVQRSSALVGGRRERVRLPPPPGPRRRLRPDPARRALGQTSAGGGLDRVPRHGPKTRRRCWPTTGSRRSSSPRPPGSTRAAA